MKHDAMGCVKKVDCSTKSIASRWVLTWKMIDGQLDVKARPVIKGFLDPQLNQIITASATASALSHRMLASYAVNHELIKSRILRCVAGVPTRSPLKGSREERRDQENGFL